MFIDNSEIRMVIEYEAEYCEDKFMTPVVTHESEEPVGYVPNSRLFTHLGLDVSWTVQKWEYTGYSYIVTIEKMWV